MRAVLEVSCENEESARPHKKTTKANRERRIIVDNWRSNEHGRFDQTDYNEALPDVSIVMQNFVVARQRFEYRIQPCATSFTMIRSTTRISQVDYGSRCFCVVRVY